jgi:hypothetical protein
VRSLEQLVECQAGIDRAASVGVSDPRADRVRKRLNAASQRVVAEIERVNVEQIHRALAQSKELTHAA